MEEIIVSLMICYIEGLAILAEGFSTTEPLNFLDLLGRLGVEKPPMRVLSREDRLPSLKKPLPLVPKAGVSTNFFLCLSVVFSAVWWTPFGASGLFGRLRSWETLVVRATEEDAACWGNLLRRVCWESPLA